MAIWIKCRICGTIEYIPHINLKGDPNSKHNKRKLFDYGFWECCNFARKQHYLVGSGKRIKLEFDVYKDWRGGIVMTPLDLDLLLRGLTVMAGTYTIFTLLSAMIAFTALAYTGIMVGIVKLYEVIKHVFHKRNSWQSNK